MKPVTWNSGIRWDDPNLRWGEPSYLLEPGDPGYVGPPPKPKHRRRARTPSPQTLSHPTPTAMDNHFHFNVTPKPTGGYTTRIVFQEDLLTPELVASTKSALAARGVTLTDEQITATGEELAKVRIAALTKCRPIRRAFGLFTEEPTCGGSHPDPDFSPTVENMNVGVRGRLAPAGQDRRLRRHY